MANDAPKPRIEIAHTGAVATITITAPRRGNSLDAELLARLEETLTGLGEETRAVVLTGAGERSFCTGYHLPSLLSEWESGLSVSDFTDHPLERALRALESVPVPTIAVVNGHAYGAGCELALTCDLRIAADSARFCLPPARLGILYSATGLQRLVALVGPAIAKEMLFTAEPVGAERALAIGMVNRVVPKVELAGTGRRLAGTISDNAPLSVRHHKTIFDRYLRPAVLTEEVLQLVAAMREECFRSPEFAARTRSKR